jgi:membrane associated rhomboid family serine protease
MYKRNFLDDIKKFFLSKSMLSRLILVNASVFILANLVSIYYYLYKISPEISLCGSNVSRFADWFAVPSNPDLLVHKPWTIFTYMFLHENFFHLLFNMIMLYFGGILFNQFIGNKKLIWVYLFGGIAGAATYFFSYNFFPVFTDVRACSLALGASASVLSIVIAAATYAPEFVIQLFLFGRIKLKYIALILVAVDILSIDKDNPGGHLAHLGGALFGLIFVLFIKSKALNYKLKIKNPFHRKPKLRVEYNHGRPVDDYEYNKRRAEKQKKIDVILDKISKSGYASLSKEEKDLLFSDSKK